MENKLTQIPSGIKKNLLFTCLDRVSWSFDSEGKLHIVSQVKLLVVKFGMHVNEITGYSMQAKLLYIL
jgi:succinylglutamate desuccinylase